MNSQQNKNTNVFDFLNKWYKLKYITIYIQFTNKKIHYFNIINPIGYSYSMYYKFKYRNNLKFFIKCYEEIKALHV